MCWYSGSRRYVRYSRLPSFATESTPFPTVALGSTLYHNWQALRKVKHKSGVEVQLIIRVLLFGVYIGLGMLYVHRLL